MPNISESLAGRMEIVTLWPFSQGELLLKKDRFIDLVFQPQFKIDIKLSDKRINILSLASKGGYLEINTRQDVSRKNAWFGSYITTILQRDIRDISNISINP